MKALALIPLVFLLASCNQAGTAVTRELDSATKAQTKIPENVKPHAVTKDKEFLADKEKAVQKGIPKKARSPVVKADPAMLGDYVFVMNANQKGQVEESMAKMEKEAAAGDKQAASALQMAKMAMEVANKMVVTLTADGRYNADFGSGNASGRFVATKESVILTPDEPSKRAGDPKDVELYFDKINQTLTADFQGEKMLFKMKS